MRQEREKESMDKHGLILAAPEEAPSSHGAGRTIGEEPIIRYIMQVKLRENPELNRQHQSREKGKT